jgi:hypothetical protein
MNMKNRTRANEAGRRRAFLGLVPALLVLAALLEAAIAITVSGSWTLSIGQSNLTGSAGSNLASAYESATNQLIMNISGLFYSTTTWRVDVRRVDTNWNANFILSIKRTNSGTSGTGALYSGGTTYAAVTTTAQTFWTGRGNRSGIYLQEKLEGVSCSIPAATYTTTLSFTVVQTN